MNTHKKIQAKIIEWKRIRANKKRETECRERKSEREKRDRKKAM